MAQVALDLSMLGSKSTPRRRSSFSGYAVRRSSTTAFGETVTGRRMSFDGDGIFGQLLGRKKLNPKKNKEDRSRKEFRKHIFTVYTNS